MNAETKDGYVIISSEDSLNGAIINLKILPEQTKVNNYTLFTSEWQDDNKQIIELADVNTNSILLIQFSENIDIATTITDGAIIFETEFKPTTDISVDIIDLKTITETIEQELISENWVEDSEFGYKASYTLAEPLQCGASGDVTPLITCNNDTGGFAYISKIIISEDKQTLIIYASNKLEHNITIQIIDFIA